MRDYYFSHEVFGNSNDPGIYLVFSKYKKRLFLPKHLSLITTCTSIQIPCTPHPRVCMEDYEFDTTPDTDYYLEELDKIWKKLEEEQKVAETEFSKSASYQRAIQSER